MQQIFKWIYYKIPFRLALFHCIKNAYSAPAKYAAYLKFQGIFTLSLMNGKSLKVYNDNSTIPTLLYWKGIEGYETQSLLLWTELCKGASNVIDIGANFGLYGLLAQKINEESQIIYFEPIKRNVDRIIKNLKINDFQAKVEQIALADFNGFSVFYDMDSEENTIGSFSRKFVEAHFHHKKIIPIEVKVLTLDSYVQNHKILGIDLIKIDVEGAEYEVIKGAQRTVIEFKPNMLIEITSEANSKKLENLFSSLSLDYEYYEIDETLGLIRRESISKLGNRNYLICRPGLIEKVSHLIHVFH